VNVIAGVSYFPVKVLLLCKLHYWCYILLCRRPVVVFTVVFIVKLYCLHVVDIFIQCLV